MKKLALIAALALTLGGCGTQVTIQSAEVAKQLGANGFENEVRSTGITRLDTCWFWTKMCPSVVKMSIGRNTNPIEIDSIYLPKSNVDTRNVKVGVQWRPRNDQASINTIYNELYSDDEGGGVRIIKVERIWKNYGERIIPARVVDALKDMTVDQVMNTSSELSEVVKREVDAALAHSPIEVTQLDVINTDVPNQVMDAKYKLFAIEDDKNRQIKQLDVGVEIERQRQALQVTRANNDKTIALLLGMTPAQYMCLKTAEKMADAADSKNATVVVSGNCGLGGSAENTVVPMKDKPNHEDVK